VPKLFFTPDDAWVGGHYELEMQVMERSKEWLGRTLQALWSQPSLEGCYLDRELEPSQQPRLSPAETTASDHLYGLATFPNGITIACGSYASCCEGQGVPPSDAVTFYLPMGSLSRAYPVGAYPFGPMEGVSAWKSELDDWLVGIGRAIYKQIPFDYALIGLEVPTTEATSRRSLQTNGIPADRFDGILWPKGDDVAWYPATRP
jgi:hypothetical protein